MNMVLRPGEALTWRWAWGRKGAVKYHGSNKPRYPATICNGLWEYKPDFSGDLWKKGSARVEGVVAGNGGLKAAEGKTGTVVWVMRSPYVFVGGRLEAQGEGAKFSVSWDGKNWLPAEGNLDHFFQPNEPAHYEYQLRCELSGDAHLDGLRIVNDLQMALLALPAMNSGPNQFVYTDQTAGDRLVQITHNWVDWNAPAPPSAPNAPIYPPDAGTTNGADIVFRWQLALPHENQSITDYQFELSDRPDMLWPLSPNFYKLISKTADSGKAQYTLPQGGLLSASRKYYWRVKAKDARGAWGPWSSTWTFTPSGPIAPIKVTMVADSEHGGALRWQPNPASQKPATYRIYGSDERGFSIYDEPFKATVGASKKVPAKRPANFVAEVTGTELAVIGADVALPNANRAYYRVVAVDAEGNRSGPSDFVEAPRPMVVSHPVTHAKVKSEYRYTLTCVRSLGDLRTRVVGGKETMNYWDIEAPRFKLEQGPAWLKIDASNGVLSGIPEGPGKFSVVVAASLDREVRKLDASSH